MKKMSEGMFLVVFLLASGCAHIDFGGPGMTYYDPKPYLFVSMTKDCVTTATVIMVPEEKKVLNFKSGYGSSQLSVTLSNGMITSVGQTTDTKIPETIASIATLGTAAAGFKMMTEKGCEATAKLYPLVGGVPDLKNPITVDPRK